MQPDKTKPTLFQRYQHCAATAAAMAALAAIRSECINIENSLCVEFYALIFIFIACVFILMAAERLVHTFNTCNTIHLI